MQLMNLDLARARLPQAGGDAVGVEDIDLLKRERRRAPGRVIAGMLFHLEENDRLLPGELISRRSASHPRADNRDVKSERGHGRSKIHPPRRRERDRGCRAANL